MGDEGSHIDSQTMLDKVQGTGMQGSINLILEPGILYTQFHSILESFFYKCG